MLKYLSAIEGKFMGKVISYLNNKNIKLNITAVYSHQQISKILEIITKKLKL